MKLIKALALSALAGLAVVSGASADTVVIHRHHGYHHHFFRPHFHRHHDRTVIIHR